MLEIGIASKALPLLLAGWIALSGFVSDEKYQVYDKKTGLTVGEYVSKNRARNKVDQLDNEYGGYRYGVKKGGIKILSTFKCPNPTCHEEWTVNKDGGLVPGIYDNPSQREQKYWGHKNNSQDCPQCDDPLNNWEWRGK